MLYIQQLQQYHLLCAKNYVIVFSFKKKKKYIYIYIYTFQDVLMKWEVCYSACQGQQCQQFPTNTNLWPQNLSIVSSQIGWIKQQQSSENWKGSLLRHRYILQVFKIMWTSSDLKKSSYLSKFNGIFLFPAEAQNTLESQECQAIEPPRKKKAPTCTRCGQPRKGHPRSQCPAASDSNESVIV